MLAGKGGGGVRPTERQLTKSTPQALTQVKGQEEAFADRGGAEVEWRRWGERGKAT